MFTQHGCDGDRHVGLEVLLVEVERGLADHHEAQGGDVGVEQVMLILPLQIHQDLVSIVVGFLLAILYF